MKNSTLSTIYTVMSQNDFADKETIMAEIAKELNRGADKRAMKASEYEKAKPFVFEALRVANTPITVAEIYEECKENLPTEFTKSRVQYGLSHQWADAVIVTDGKVKAYSLR